eukprot:SAG31_NODE_25611_length_458_cov_0.657382_1_plen_45_part_01
MAGELAGRRGLASQKSRARAIRRPPDDDDPGCISVQVCIAEAAAV